MKVNGLSGLVNLGNTCYMNSIIQCLSNIKQFNKKIIEYNGNCQIILQFKKILIEIWKENYPISPKSFKKTIDNDLQKYSGNEQHDAHEFLLDFFELLHKEMGEKYNSNSISNNINILKANNIWDSYFNSSKSIISSLFYGQYVNYITCEGCENVSHTFDPFIDINIYCNKPDKTIKKLIKDRFARNYIYKPCEECNGNTESDTEHEIISYIYKLPEILLVYINRFTKTSKNNNNNNLIIDNEINLSNYSMDNNVIYTLKSIICHTGNLNSGHYFSLVKNGNNWYCFNDNKVTLFNISNIDKSSPYILFYDKNK